METGEIFLDEHGEEQLRRWVFYDNPTAEQHAWVESVLAGLAVKTPYVALGEVANDLATGDVAITCPYDRTVTVVVIPWPGEACEFSLRYVGDLGAMGS